MLVKLRIKREPGRADTVYSVTETIKEGEPVRCLSWYGPHNINPALVEDGQEATYHAGGEISWYCTLPAHRGTKHARTDGNVPPALIERFPIECPKTKLTTRYERGRWEKHHAKRGWVPA